MHPTEFTYPASAVTPDSGAGEVTGSLRVDAQGLWFEHPDGLVGLPFARLRVERADDGRLQFTDPGQPGSAVFTAEEAVLRQQPFRQRLELRRQVREMDRRREGRRMVRLSVVFLAVFAAAVTAVVWGGRLLVNFVVARVPVAWEVALGEAALKELTEDVEVVNAPEQEAYLRTLAAALGRGLPAHGYQFKFQVVRYPLPNAFAVPGGTIVVTTGLLEKAGGSEEVAGVLAHEFAHVLRRHGLRQMITGVGPLFLLSKVFGDRESFIATVSAGSAFLLKQSASRQYESEADDLAWTYLAKARVDPRGQARFLERLKDDPIYRVMDERTPGIFRSHPPDAERIAALNARWERASLKAGFGPLPPLPPPL